MSATFARFTQAVGFFDEIFEHCDLVNGLMQRILATHPEGFDDAARKVYDTALANANRKLGEKIEHVVGLDSGVLTMTNSQDKFKHECNVTRFVFGGLVLTLRGRVCLNSEALKKFVLNQKILRMKKLGKDKASQSSGPISQEAKSGSMNPQDFWEKLTRSAKPEDAKLKEILESMTSGDKCILFVNAGACEINNMIFESLPGARSEEHKKEMSEKLKNVNSRLVEAVEHMDGMESVILSLTKSQESSLSQQMVEIATQRKDGVRGVWITICGAEAIQLANDLAEAAASNDKAFQHEMHGRKGAQQVKAEGRAAAKMRAGPGDIKQEGVKHGPDEEMKDVCGRVSGGGMKQEMLKQESIKQESA